jgi:hypothetical protein
VAEQYDPQSPEWWVKRLYQQIQKQREYFEVMDAYYRGQPPRYPWLPEQAQEEFTRLLSMTRANVLGLVVDAVAERLQVDGFRIGDNPTADQATWAIWQANNMDSASDQAILEALIGGTAYTLVAPNDREPATPRIWAEHPSQATIAYVPGSARQDKAAALKVWCDDWTGWDMATLYLPDEVFKFQSKRKAIEGSSYLTPQWEPREVRGEAWPAENPLGEVPLNELPNNPRLLTGGISEIDDLIPTQDRINKTLADRLMTQDYGAFPQRWAIGYPDADAQGNVNRIDVGRNRMVTSDVAETRFGQWDSAPLDPYSAAKREDVRDAASRSRTPAQYLLGDMSNVNGETLKASESGLVSKSRQRMRPMGEGLEGTMRLARRIAGIGGDDAAMETIWKNPEFRTEGELVDALVKMAGLGVPQEALWERWGASQVEIERWKAMREQQARLDPVGQLTQAIGQGSPDQPPGYDAGAP